MTSPVQRRQSDPILPTLLPLAPPNVLAVVMTVWISSRGSGKVLGPLLAGTVRLLAATMAAHGLSTAAGVKFTPWGRIH